MVTLVLFAAFFLLVFIGVPIALSLGLSSLITIVFTTDLSPDIIVQKAFASLDSYPLLAIPLFYSRRGINERGRYFQKIIKFS